VTKQDITLGATSVTRHVMTLGAGLLAAHGIAGGDQLEGIGAAVAVFIATLAWSFIENNKLLSGLVEALPVSELESLASNLLAFRRNGANPLLIANIAQTAMAVANQELLAAHPELAPPAQSNVQLSATPEPAAVIAPPQPAPAPVSPPVGEPVQPPSDDGVIP
jgi:hypothetical protein